MRNDLNKIVGETYRHHHTAVVKPGRSVRSVEDLSSHEGIRSPYQARWAAMKEQKSKYTPLRRYLDKQVGRSWDDVHGELRQAYDIRSVVNKRLWEMVENTVTTKGLFVQDGKVMEQSAYCPPFEPRGLFVHPETRVLCRAEDLSYRKINAERRAEKAAALAAKEVKVSESLVLRKLESSWFAVELAPVTPPVVTKVHKWTDTWGRERMREEIDEASVCRDVLTSNTWDSTDPVFYTQPQTYAKSKRQMSHKELKHYGLVI